MQIGKHLSSGAAMTLHERSMKLLEHRIRTLHDKHEFKFVFLGDSRGYGSGCEINGHFELVLKKAVKLNPLFIIHGGDCTFTGDEESLKHFVQIVKKIAPKTPVFVAVGNHDVPKENTVNLKTFRKIIGTEHWVIDIPKFHFLCIALNNMKSIRPKDYGFTDRELNYLESRLYNSPNNTILTMHVQPGIDRWVLKDPEDIAEDPESKVSFSGFPVNTAESKRFFELIERYNVKKVLVSHKHGYDQQFLRIDSQGNVNRGKGTDFVLSGGAGAPIEAIPPLGIDPLNPTINNINHLTLNDFNFVEFYVNKHSIFGPILWRDFGTPGMPCL